MQATQQVVQNAVQMYRCSEGGVWEAPIQVLRMKKKSQQAVKTWKISREVGTGMLMDKFSVNCVVWCRFRYVGGWVGPWAIGAGVVGIKGRN